MVNQPLPAGTDGLPASCWTSPGSTEPPETKDEVETKQRKVPNRARKAVNTTNQPKILMRARKVRVYPTNEQRKTLNQWFWAIRWTYNQCVDWLTAAEQPKYDIKELRARFVTSTGAALADQDDVLSVPYDIRDGAVEEIVEAYRAYCAKQTVNHNGFRLAIRSTRSQLQQTMVVRSKHWGKTRGAYSKLFGQTVLATSSQEPLPQQLPADSKLTRDRLGRYYLCIPEPIVHQDPDPEQHEIVSIDPGVRTFLTCYSPTSGIIEIGAGDSSRLNLLHYHLDQLRSRMRSAKSKQYKSMRRAALRMEARIRNLVDDVHKKSAHWLLSRFKVVLLPLFSVSKMVAKKKNADGSRPRRTLAKSTVRAMLDWSHFRFRQRLIQAAERWPNTRVHIVTEEYTSLTCGQCGIKRDKFSHKTFRCKACGLVLDRDTNASRNILIKWLTEAANKAASHATEQSAACLGPDPCSRTALCASDKGDYCKAERKQG